MKKEGWAYQLDHYCRREDTFLARACQQISPTCGEEYLQDQYGVKRAWERTLAVLSLPVTVPLILGLAGGVLVTSGVPAFYKQERQIGERVMPVYKLRSMVNGADRIKRAQEIAEEYPAASDPRNTPFGRFLRRFDLDELPQLVQVALGQIDLVGLRLLPEESIVITKRSHQTGGEKWERRYNSQRNGAIVSLFRLLDGEGKKNARRVNPDLFYLEKASLGLDLYILARLAISRLSRLERKVTGWGKVGRKKVQVL